VALPSIFLGQGALWGGALSRAGSSPGQGAPPGQGALQGRELLQGRGAGSSSRAGSPGSPARRPVGQDRGSSGATPSRGGPCHDTSSSFAPALPHAPACCFRDCRSSAANIATFDPRSRWGNMTSGILFHFAMVGGASPLPLSCFDPRSSDGPEEIPWTAMRLRALVLICRGLRRWVAARLRCGLGL
jgi:hypothetical protein